MAIEEREIGANTNSSSSSDVSDENRAASKQSLRARKAQERVRRAQLERSVIKLRVAGVTYEQIARELKIPNPEKPDATAARRIWNRALKKIEVPDVSEARRVHVLRLEDGFFNLQKKTGGWTEGAPRAVEVGLQLLDQEAKLIGTYPAPNVNLPAQNVNVTVVDRVEFVALPEPSAGINAAHRLAPQAGEDARGVDEPAGEDSGGGGRDGNGQDVVRPDLGVGPAS
jgi:hypothetical protein